MQFTRRTVIVVLALLSILIVLGFLTYSFIAPQGLFSGLPNDLKALQADDSVRYTDLDGNIVDLNTFKGKPLIINSWATWIPFSQTELPLLGQLKQKHGDAITVIAINRMENSGMIRSFMSTFTIPDSIILLSDPTDNFYKAIEGYAMPETLFYDADGNIVAHIRGVLSEVEAENYINSMLTDN